MRRRFFKTLTLALFCGLPLSPGCDETSQPDLPPLWDAPTFSLTDQDNKPFGTEQLKGNPWIAMLFFTTCSGPCPMMAMRMRDVQDAIPDPAVKIVSFSVDPAFDTPQRMKEYAARVKAEPGRWYFLTGEDTQIEAVAAGLKLMYDKPPATGPASQATLIDHSTKFLLIDGANQVRGIYDSDDDASLAQLKKDAAAMARER